MIKKQKDLHKLDENLNNKKNVTIEKKCKLTENQNRKLEVICILALIVIALISFTFTNFVFKNKSTYTAIMVYMEDDVVYEEKIENLVDKEVILYTKNDGLVVIEDIDKTDEDIAHIKGHYAYNVLRIENKKISCIESNCPNQVCVAHGTIRDDIDNDMIVCAPHKMTIIYK